MTAGDTLARYFLELKREPRFSVGQERAEAERIARLRLAYWAALLEDPAAGPTALSLLSPEKRPCQCTPEALAAADPSCDIADALLAERRDRPEFFGLERARLALREARQAFARANLRLVVTMARRYGRRSRLDLTDLIQEGNIGLMAAIDRFDPARGFRFSTYAAWWIRHAVLRGLAQRTRVVRLPSHVLELQSKVARAESDFEQEHGRVPQVDELATRAGVTPRKVRRLGTILVERADAQPGARELDAQTSVGPAAEVAIEGVQLGAALGEALKGLAPIEARVVALRFGFDGGEGLTLREIGSEYALSRERIRQIQARALGKLRDDLARRGHADPPAVEAAAAAAV